MRTIGTAGHVDHGKSTLVHALTGINPDRLQEEKDRQMTIDLGFAWLSLADGQEVGIVDVPGHRDFIENMLAGVGAIDAVLFVIAADEGIMPQTREHLAILDLLQIPKGIIVISKIDLVDEEWLALVVEEAAELFSGTLLARAPIVPVSASNQIGLDQLTLVLTDLLADTPEKPDRSRPRLSIDRVFSLTGFGTVVTGTLIGGSLRDGQEVEILPGKRKGRIRSLQSHKSQREVVMPGGRVALNLSGLGKSELKRGDTVVLPGQWTTTSIIDARLKAVDDLVGPLKHNQEVKLYIGASQSVARVRLIGRKEIASGEEDWVQLVLTDEIVTEKGDRFILRRPSPGAILGGGQVVDAHPLKRYRMTDRTPVDRLEKLLEGDPGDVLVEYIQSSGPITAGDIVQASVIEDAFSVIGQLIQTGELIKLGRAELTPKSYIVTKARWEETGTQSQKILSAYHLKYPLRAGMPVQEFKTKMGLDPKWAMPWIESAREYSWLEYSQTAVRAFKHSPALTSQQDTAAKKLLVEMEANPYSTPSKKEILGDLGEELLDYLIGTGELIQVSDDVIFSMRTYQISVERIKNVLQDKGTISVAEVRDMFNTTRKYALALMEYLDEAGVTVREGDVRKLLH